MYIHIHIRMVTATAAIACAFLTPGVRSRGAAGEDSDERVRKVFRAEFQLHTWLPYSTLSAHSVKWVFPFQGCKLSPKQPQIYFRGG